MDEQVTVSLPSDEALVLLGWLWDIENDELVFDFTSHRGEVVALLNLSVALRQQIDPETESFRDDVMEARERVAASD